MQSTDLCFRLPSEDLQQSIYQQASQQPASLFGSIAKHLQTILGGKLGVETQLFKANSFDPSSLMFTPPNLDINRLVPTGMDAKSDFRTDELFCFAPDTQQISKNPVFELIMTQAADGSFPWSDVIRTWFGDNRVNKVSTAIATWGEIAIATASAIFLLETEAPEHIDEWRLAVKKAKQWLASHCPTLDIKTLL
ncbi:hypothetical protein TI04_11990 [Achromatium sp. WMS2]|nr:hypothetical protein TI04_11990 [Achromatium sp. WMS2]